MRTERPILFSGPMVRAILEGRKTVTRRVIKPRMRSADSQFVLVQRQDGSWSPIHTFDESPMDARGTEHPITCPYGNVGNHLWVRESWQDVHPVQVADGRYSQAGQAGIPGPPGVTYRTIYRADGPYPCVYHSHAHPYRCLQPDPEHASTWEAESGYTGWTPSIHMPRWASRILLEITDVRIERLQDISEEQAIAEGVRSCERDIDPDGNDYSPVELFGGLWVKLNGMDSWSANPWVWVVEFRRITP